MSICMTKKISTQPHRPSPRTSCRQTYALRMEDAASVTVRKVTVDKRS